MANLVISGGVTLSGSFEAGFNAAPVQLLASSMVWDKGSNFWEVAPTVTGTFSIDTLDIPVSSGTMSMSYHLKIASFTGSLGFVSTYTLQMPAGYAISGAEGVIVGTGLIKSDAYPAGKPLNIYAYASTQRLVLNTPGWGGYLGHNSDPTLNSPGFEMEFTASIPVVAV